MDSIFTKRKCLLCSTGGGYANKLFEYSTSDKESFFICSWCNSQSDYNAVFNKDEGDKRQNIGGEND